jgi:hypothetical protein
MRVWDHGSGCKLSMPLDYGYRSYYSFARPRLTGDGWFLAAGLEDRRSS